MSREDIMFNTKILITRLKVPLLNEIRYYCLLNYFNYNIYTAKCFWYYMCTQTCKERGFNAGERRYAYNYMTVAIKSQTRRHRHRNHCLRHNQTHPRHRQIRPTNRIDVYSLRLLLSWHC